MRLRSIRDFDFNNVCKFVANTFASHEPMCRALKINEDDIMNTFDEIIYKCCTQKVSSLIEHDNKIASVSLLLPYKTYNETQVLQTPESIQPIINMLNKISSTNVPSHIDENTTLYHFIVGTDVAYANQGYSRQVIKHSYNNAIKNKYNYVIADATNKVSQNILSKYFNFHEHAKMDYRDFECFTDIKCTQYVKRMFTKLEMI
jgi:hypothetical protein